MLNSKLVPDREQQRTDRINRARRYVAALSITHKRALLFGSVARGDFTQESDTDLLIISPYMPESIADRMTLLSEGRTVAPEVEAIGWTEDEWLRREGDGDAFLDLLKKEGVPLQL